MPAECAVGSSIGDTAAQSVEVSGWDAENQFFVEIADLDRNESGDPTTRLCHRVNSGSLVFVRLLCPRGESFTRRAIPPPMKLMPSDLRISPAVAASGSLRVSLGLSED